MDLNLLAHHVGTWTRKNFGPPSPLGIHPLLGIMEEVGELAHAHLKQVQGIRGTAEEHIAEAKDAIGDIVIYLADYCDTRGFRFEDIVAEVWKNVEKRDWTEERERNLTKGAGSIDADEVIAEPKE